jgi:hypothetical protein
MVSGCGEAFPLKRMSEVAVACGAHDLYPPPISIRLGRWTVYMCAREWVYVGVSE